MVDEVEVREMLKTEIKQFYTTIVENVNSYYCWIPIAVFVSGVGLPVGIAMNGNNLLFSIATAIMQKSFEGFAMKWKENIDLSCLLKAN